MVELVLQKPVAILRASGSYLGNLLLLDVEIDLEMLSGQHPPVKICVLYLVLAEVVLSLRGASQHENKGYQEGRSLHLI